MGLAHNKKNIEYRRTFKVFKKFFDFKGVQYL